MVLFEKIFSNDKRDATCSPCDILAHALLYYAFMSKQKLGILYFYEHLFHFIQYM